MPVPVDPLELLLKPPAEESPADRALRLQREEHARQVSAAIDATIKAERNARRKKRIVRLLLLGQSESGAPPPSFPPSPPPPDPPAPSRQASPPPSDVSAQCPGAQSIC
jgi:hypothetical protein